MSYITNCLSKNFSIGSKYLDENIQKNIFKYLEPFEYCDECYSCAKYESFLNNNRENKNKEKKNCKYRKDLLKQCYYCRKTLLCNEHYIRACKWGSFYRRASCGYPMCDACCWFEIG